MRKFSIINNKKNVIDHIIINRQVHPWPMSQFYVEIHDEIDVEMIELNGVSAETKTHCRVWMWKSKRHIIKKAERNRYVFLPQAI